LLSSWHSGSSGNQGQWSCGHGMVYFGDNDLALALARDFFQKRNGKNQT